MGRRFVRRFTPPFYSLCCRFSPLADAFLGCTIYLCASQNKHAHQQRAQDCSQALLRLEQRKPFAGSCPKVALLTVLLNSSSCCQCCKTSKMNNPPLSVALKGRPMSIEAV